MKYRIKLLMAVCGLAALAVQAQATSVTVENLRCEYNRNPLGIDSPQPRLSWELASSERGQIQTARQILAASSLEVLNKGKGDLWDSGKVESDQSVQVEYSGKPLISQTQVYWKVRVWDKQQEPSAWSQPAMWSMGILKPSDWLGTWIGATDDFQPPNTGATMGYHAAEARAADTVKWVQVDFGSSRKIDFIKFHPPTPPGFEDTKGFGFPIRFRIELSDASDFSQANTIADFTGTDYPNPGNEGRLFPARGVEGRYLRVTATKLWNRGLGPDPFCFALGELEAVSGETNAALHARVTALDSVEASGWSQVCLTDGIKISSTIGGGETDRTHAAVLLRKNMTVTHEFRRATAYICGLGYSELYINGRKVGDHVLDPGFTDFTKRTLYLTHDVTDLLKPGTNAIGVILGGGWYHLGTPDLFGFERAPWVSPPKLRFQLVVEYTDGHKQIMVSDPSWKWSTGEIVFNCVRGGETIDAREAKLGWNLAGYDDIKWAQAVSVKAPVGRLVSQQHPPIRITRLIRPVKLTEPKPGVYLFDLGVNIAGFAKLKTTGLAGQKITLEYNELLNADGTLNAKNLSSHTNGRFQTEEFILKGGGIELFEPRFTYHGFQYVQVTGLSEKPTLETLTGCWVTTDPAKAGEFSCSNERINQLQEVFVRTHLNNLHGIPTDCPQREKMGWLNDGCVCIESGIYNLDSPQFYTKWFHDMQDNQDANGHVPDFVPTCGWGRSKADGSPGEMADPWWGGAAVLTPWKLYLYYADTRILQEGYPSMKAYVNYLTLTSSNSTVSWGLGDWLDESAGGGGRRVPVLQTSTAAYFYYAQIVSQTAALLGNKTDAEKYASLAATIRTAFNVRFLDAKNGLYSPDSQTAQALPLYLGLAPEEYKKKIAAQLFESITGARKTHISAGIVGTLYVYHTLMQQGRDDLAYAMMTQEDYPGWLNMINRGETTVWEAWNGASSHNHPTFGCVGYWFYQGLAGIRPDPSAPGFKKMTIKPAVLSDLHWAKGKYHSVHGVITSDWHHKGGVFVLKADIPANTSATIYVPAKNIDGITESGKPVTQAAGVKFMRQEESFAVFEVGSGRYHFESKSFQAPSSPPNSSRKS